MTAVQHFIYLLILLDLLVLLNIVILAIFTLLTGDTFGYCFALILFAVAAADTAIGLGLFIVYFRILNSPAVS
jgi:NADH:ubiquinone oxidoreductase subunit K